MKEKHTFLQRLPIMLVLLALLWPDAVWADDSDVFTTIGNKLVTTVQDLRTIVYVIAGFGLIMFAVLAVFNKLSWKHLMYICTSLFLLSVMMPFINYFAGSSLTDNTSQQDWGDKLGDTFQNATGSNADATSDCTSNCPTGSSSGSDGSSALSAITGGGAGSLASLAGTTDPSAGLGDLLASKQAELKASQEECTAAGNKWDASTNKCKTSLKNTLKNIATAASQGAAAVQQGVSAVKSAEATISNAQKTLSDVGDAISNIGSSHGLGDLVNNLGVAASTIGSDVTHTTTAAGSTFASAQNAADNASNAAATITGTEDNFVTKTLGSQQLKDATNTGRQAAGDASSEVHDYTDPIGSTAGSVNAASNALK